MVTAFVSATRGDSAPSLPVVVATGDLAPGEVLDSSSLRTERVEVPESIASRTFGSAVQLEGAVTLAPIGAGEMVQRAAVLTPGDGTDGRTADGIGHEYSFAVDTDRALGGAIVPGEVVDVVATMGSGEGAYTAVVARGAVVVAVTQGGGGLGSTATTITLGLGGSQEVLELAHAREVGSISVVRATRAPRGEPAPPPHRPRLPR